ncbi:MAG: 2OG-Fe(II) oxygenase [Candidatus Eremiobacteraeota bacterium]|nr:2OG-Fe(II) oxygenase [Candidatus Eremiobacteraeota bacterium]
MLAPERCVALIAATRASTTWRDAPIYTSAGGGAVAVVNDAVRRAALLDEHDLPPDAAAIVEDAKRAVEQHVAAHTPGLRAGDVQLVRYEPGGFFYTHQDATASPREWRKLSAVVYLNDDFTGGTTSFPVLDRIITPRTGHALLFVPHLVHGAELVERGEKFVLTFWLGPSSP